MKKLGIGCLIVFVVVGVAGVLGAYYVYRRVTSTVGQFAELAEVPDLERQVRNTGPFSPPESAELSQSQVERLVRVQGRVRERLGERFAELQRRHRALLEKKEATALDLPELLAAYRDLAATWMDAKRAQVDALNEAGFSLAEYRWVRSQSYAAIGLPIMDIDFARMIEDAKGGKTVEQPGAMGGSVGPTGPESNQKLVEPYREQLEDNVALASLGL